VAIVTLLTISPQVVDSQVKPQAEYQLKAAFLYNFTRFIEWPVQHYNSPSSPFIIGVLGKDPFGAYLDELVKGERIDGHPIEVQRFDDIKDIRRCNILFLHSDSALRLKEAIPALNQKGILTVSDASNFARWGGAIRFFKEDNKLRLQINTASIKVAQLNISSKLLNLAKIYKD
jgi:hypothetical protein